MLIKIQARERTQTHTRSMELEADCTAIKRIKSPTTAQVMREIATKRK
jgi:hypothetical protein